MNRYIIIHRLRWPALLLLTGVIALLAQAHILSWGRAWPLYLILFGVLALAERATFAAQPPPDPQAYPYGYAPPAGYPADYAAGYPPPGYQGTWTGAPPAAPPPVVPQAGTSIVPAPEPETTVEPTPRKSWDQENS